MLFKVLYISIAVLLTNRIYADDLIALSPVGPISTWQDEDVNLTCDTTSTNNVLFKMNSRNIRIDNTNFTVTVINSTVSVLKIHSIYMTTCEVKQFSCASVINSEIHESNRVNVTVTPPIQKVDISQTHRTEPGNKENMTVNLICSTPCNCTRPTIKWNVRDRDNIQFIDNQTECLPSSSSVTSRLTYMVNRLDNGSYVNCTASNENRHPVFSSNITLIVYYPPGNIIMSGGSGNEYSVIEHTRGTLTCTVNGGNPIATLSWNCSFANVDTQQSISSVQNTISWDASRVNSKKCACISNHTLYLQPEIATKQINVLYPPKLANMSNINVIENSSLTIVCYVKDSNPEVIEVNWKKAGSNKVLSNNVTLSIRIVTKEGKGSYVCSVQNIMEPTDGNSRTGTNRKQFHLDVLYPPQVNTFSNVSIWEGEPLDIKCTVSEGNPRNTYIKWTRGLDSRMWTTNQLSIASVKRNDSSTHTCTAWNVMNPTNRSKENGTHSRMFILDVKYETTINVFSINTSDGRLSNTLPENTDFSLVCQADGNPLPNMTIMYMDDTLKNKTLYDNVSVHKSASCTDLGEYTCQASNRKSQLSTKSINIYVLCTPRRNPKVTIDFILASALYQNVTFTYTALAYPHPTFTWYRDGSSIDTNDPRTSILSSNLTTNLTITRIDENDFGNYSINIINEVGSITEDFHLKPQGVPEVPTHFKQHNASTSHSSIGLYWVSGFNNGLEQTFTLLYKKLQDGNWRSVNVLDTGTGTIIYNITGLSSDTFYIIVLFSSNNIGRSKNNVTLNCATGLAVRTPIRDAHSQNSSAIVGGVVGVVVLIGITITVFICRRRLHKCQCIDRSSDGTESPAPITYENLKIDIIPNPPIDSTNDHTSKTNVDNTYEGLHPRDNGKENEYMQLEGGIADSR